MEQESNQLVAAYLAGDEGAFEKLVHVHLVSLYNFVFLIVREKEVAEDVVQETFIKVWKNLKHFRQSQKFKAWLYTIAKNTAFDFLKKKRPRTFSSFTEEEWSAVEQLSAEQPEIVEEIEKAERTAHLDYALGRVPPLYRALLVLVYREDFSLKEAAEILGEPYNTIKSRHQRAIIQLKEHLLSASQASL